MALDLDAVAIALATAVNDAQITLNGQRLTALDAVPSTIAAPPLFAVAEFVNTYHRSFAGMDEVTFTCRLFVSLVTSEDGQRTARQAASSAGAKAILDALEAARGDPGQPALGGAAQDLVVQNVRGPRIYEIGEKSYYGLEFSVFVLG